MSRNPQSIRVSRNINTTVEVKTVGAEELNRPEVVEIQPTEKKVRKDSKTTNKFGGK